MIKKWFSFNSKTQRTEVVEPSPEVFETSSLLFWTRGLQEWVSGTVALEFFLKPEEIKEPLPAIEVVVMEKKEAIKPKNLEVKASPPIVCPVVATASKVIKTKNIKKTVKKPKKPKTVKKTKKSKLIKKRVKQKSAPKTRRTKTVKKSKKSKLIKKRVKKKTLKRKTKINKK